MGVMSGTKTAEYIVFHFEEGDVWKLVQRVPEIVLGRRVLVAAFDSGPLHPNPEELDAGWSVLAGTAFSPPVSNIDQLPTAEWDEWWVFDGIPDPVPRIDDPFVNYTGFSLRDAREVFPEPEPTHDRGLVEACREALSRLQERFWTEAKRCRPLSFVCDGVVATRDASIAERLRTSYPAG